MAFINKMKGQEYIDKTRDYLNYLEEHLENVRRAFTELSKICDGMYWVGDDMFWHTLRVEVERHDVSKFSKEEFCQYRSSFYPINQDDKINSDFDSAWEHHKKQNTHHNESAETYMDVIHMIIDWTAMGYRLGGTAQEFYENNESKIKISEKNKKDMYEIFDKIKKYGEVINE